MSQAPHIACYGIFNIMHILAVLTQMSSEMNELHSYIQYVCVNHLAEFEVVSLILIKLVFPESTECIIILLQILIISYI